jgi:hypothetical protein
MRIRSSVITTLLVLVPMSLVNAAENETVVAAAPQPAMSHTITYTSGARIDKVKLINARGGTGTRTCELLAADGQTVAKLPNGITFDQDCSLSGTFEAASDKPSKYAFQVRVRDQGGGVASVPVAMVINPPLDAKVDTASLTSGGNIAQPIYPFRISGGTGNTQIVFVNPQGEPIKAPSGMEFSPDGSISGKVPATSAALDPMQALISDQGGGRVMVPMVWRINPPLAMEVRNVELTAGGRLDAPMQIVKVTGGSGAIRANLYESDGKTPAVLPEGMQFNEINGTLEGRIPGVVSEKKCVIKAVDQGGGGIERPFIFKVNPQLQVELIPVKAGA